MANLREFLSNFSEDRLALGHTAGKAYIISAHTRKDFPRLIMDYGDAEIVRIDAKEQNHSGILTRGCVLVYLDKEYRRGVK